MTGNGCQVASFPYDSYDGIGAKTLVSLAPLLDFTIVLIHPFLLAERSTDRLQSRDPFELFEFTHQFASTIWTTERHQTTPGRTSRATSEFSWTAACSVATVWWKLQHNGSVRCGSAGGSHGIPWNPMECQQPQSTQTSHRQNQPKSTKADQSRPKSTSSVRSDRQKVSEHFIDGEVMRGHHLFIDIHRIQMKFVFGLVASATDCDQVWVSNCIGCGDESNLTVVAVRSLKGIGTRFPESTVGLHRGDSPIANIAITSMFRK